MVWIDSTYAQTLTPSPSVTGGLGSGAGQNNPGGGYSTPVQPSYQPPVPSRQYAPSADPNGRYYSDDGGTTWGWEDYPQPQGVTAGLGYEAGQNDPGGVSVWGWSETPDYWGQQNPGNSGIWNYAMANPGRDSDIIDHRPTPAFDQTGVGFAPYGDPTYYEDGSYNYPYTGAPSNWIDYGQVQPGDADQGLGGFPYTDPRYGDADMGVGGSVANLPGYGSQPELDQWRNNPEGLRGTPEFPTTGPFGLPSRLPKNEGGFFGNMGENFNTAMYPFDYIAEVGADLSPGLVRANPITGGWATAYDAAGTLTNAMGGPDLPDFFGNPRTVPGEVWSDIQSPNQAVEEFRDRPWYQQLGAGAVFDPLNFVGAGYADDVVDVARRAPDIAGPAMRGLGQYGSDVMEGSMRSIGDFTGLGPGTMPEVDAPMVFRTGQKPGSSSKVMPESWADDFRPDPTNALPGYTASYYNGVETGAYWQSGDGWTMMMRNDPTGIGIHKYATEAEARAALQEMGQYTKTAGSPAPLANERLWFHSTNDMVYDLPDPDLAVGQSTGITQGPGIYMAADPGKSAGKYGNRTFVSEFDGNTLDLTKMARPTEPVFPDGTNWVDFYESVAARLDEIGMPAAAARVRRFVPELANNDVSHVTLYKPRAEGANFDAASGLANAYHYREALVDAIAKSSDVSTLWGYGPYVDNVSKIPMPGMTDKEILGRFAGAIAHANDNGNTVSLAFVQNQLADHGIDALFHHSPRADGDVLIVLNGEKARVVADARNAADALTKSKNLGELKATLQPEIERQAARKAQLAETMPEHFVARRQGNSVFVVDSRTGEDVGRGALNPDGTVYGSPYGPTRGGETYASEDAFAKAVGADAATKMNQRANSKWGNLDTEAKWYDNETGGGRLPNLSGVGRALAPTAIQSGIGAAAGAAVGGYASGDWEGALKGAAIGAAAGAGAGTAARGANALGSRGVPARAGTPSATISGAPKEATIKLAQLIKAAKPARAETEALKHAELSRRVGRGAGMLGQGTDSERAFYRSKGALKGELPVAQYEAPRPEMLKEEIASLFDHIRDSNLQFFQKHNTFDALVKTLAGQIPTRGEITLLENAFGKDLAKAILGKRALGTKAWEATVDSLNLPRTVVTAWDASAPLRQGIMLAAGRPKQFAGALGPMVRAMASPKFAGHVDDAIRNSPNAGLYERASLYIAPSDVSGALTGREEAFMSRLASKIPGVAGSERGYTTFLNKLRTDVFDSIVSKWDEATRTDENLQRLGNWLNIATGRGAGFSGKPGEILTATFFSPRYVSSRFQAIGEGAKAVGGVTADAARLKNPLADPINKEVIRDLAAFVLTGATVLTLAKMSGAGVELDPRSSDFGKLRLGPTRYDFWGGEQQIARLVAQIATNQRKTTSTGDIVNLNRAETLGRFVQSKLSPQAGFGLDALRGETYTGDEMSLSKSSFRDQAFNRFVPLFIQDITEAVMEDGWQAGIKALPSGAGVSTQTYLSTREVSDRIAQRLFPGKSFVELNKGQQRTVRDDPEYKQWVSQYDDNVVPPDTKVSVLFDQWAKAKPKLEADLRADLDRNLQGRALRDRLNEFKDTRYVTGQALLDDPDVQASFNKKGSTAPQDAFADLYWSAQAQEDPATGKPDFETRDRERARILAEAKAAGVDTNYITSTTGTYVTRDGKTENAYLAQRYADPVVRAAIERLDGDRQALDESGFFDTKLVAWEEFKKKYPQQLGGFGTYSEWYAASVKLEEDRLRRAGQPEAAVLQKAKEAVANYNTTEKFNEFHRTQFRHRWVVDNKDLALTAYYWDYFEPDKAEEKFLGIKK